MQSVRGKLCLVFLVLAVFVGIGAGACGNGGEDGRENGAGDGEAVPSPTVVLITEVPKTPTPTPETGVGVEVSTLGAVFSEGQRVNLVITLTAFGPETLYYQTSQRYDLVVSAWSGEEVWRWSLGQTFGQVLGEESLERGETVSYSESWDQKDNDGDPVPPGAYLVVGESTHCDKNYENCGVASAPKQIQITGS